MLLNGLPSRSVTRQDDVLSYGVAAESACLAMLLRREGEYLCRLLTHLDAAIARVWDEGEFTDETNAGR
ncbi:hypothetical protein MASR2M16_16680 [Thauera terpenica]